MQFTTKDRASGPRTPLVPSEARQLALDAHASAVILVEGWSDQAAIDTLARRRGWDLRAEGILTLPTGGVTNFGAFIQVLGASGLGLGLAGLCDAGEEAYARRVLELAGMGNALTHSGMEAAGFFVCEADLEDELIRSLGAPAVEAVVQAQGELGPFRRFQAQPAQRGRPLEAHLRRFIGTRAGRKVRYGSLLVDALDLARVPSALDSVVDHARAQAGDRRKSVSPIVVPLDRSERFRSSSTKPRSLIMSDHSVRLHRVLRAKPEKVYRAFLQADAMAKWLPPYGFTCTVHHFEPVVGGTFKMSFRNFSTGNAHAFGGEYLELVPNQRIRYTDTFDDPNMPGVMSVTVDLREVSCGTELTVVQADIPAMIPLEMCYLGWQESLLQLAALVEPDIPG